MSGGGGQGGGQGDGPAVGAVDPAGERLTAALRVLRACGHDLDADQVLDVLWLARLLPPSDARAPLVPVRPSPVAAPDPVEPGGRDDTAEEAVPPAPDPEDLPDLTAPSLYAAAQPKPVPDVELWRAADRPRPALPVRVPERKALAQQLELGRALRPLRRRLASRDRLEIDVERTVSALAETRVPDVVQRPVRERWLHLVLLVDDGLSMLLWHRLGAELRTLLERLGAFASLRVHGLDTRAPDGPRLRARPFRRDSPELPTSSVNDPSGRTLVLVVSDGMGAAWRRGDMHRLLELWAARGPVSVLHTLPPEMWEASGVTADRWQATTLRSGGANTSWQIADPVLPRGLADFDGVPVPVLEPTVEALGRWAHLLVSPGATVELPLLARPSRRAPVAPGRAAQGPQHFKDAATPEAYRLAAHLAAVAPLSVPVMRLVQGAVPWPARTSHLAEVFLGGLLRPHPAPVPEPVPAKHRVFDFTAESKAALLDAVPQAELLRTGRTIGRQLERLAGRSPDFPAWLAHPAGGAEVAGGQRPFTNVERRLLSRFGVAVDRPEADGPATADPSAGARPMAAAEHGWEPLLPDDPTRLGQFRLTGRRRGRRTIVYRGYDEVGAAVVVRVPRPDLPAAARLIETEAEALHRLDGRYAPQLLGASLSGSPPWLAMTPVEESDPPAQPLRLSDLVDRATPTAAAPFDKLAGLYAAWQLATALDVCHVNGLVPAGLGAESVFVLRRSIVLGDLSDCAIDGEYAGSGPVPTPYDNVLALGDLLRLISSRAGLEVRGLPEGMHVWQGPTWDALRLMVLRCLDPDPRERPTPGEVAGLLSQYLATARVQGVGGVGATAPPKGAGRDDAAARLPFAPLRVEPREDLLPLRRFGRRGVQQRGRRGEEDQARLTALRTPLAYGRRVTLVGPAGDERGALTVALGSLLAAVRGEPVLAVDGSPAEGALARFLRARNEASWKDLAALPPDASYEDVRGCATVLPSGLEVVAHRRSGYFGVNPGHAQEYMRVLAMTAPHYAFVLTDWAPPALDQTADVVLNHTDRLVLWCRDDRFSRDETVRKLARLRDAGHGALADGAVVALGTNAKGRPYDAYEPDDFAQDAGIPAASMATVPADPVLVHAGYALGGMQPATVRALLDLARLLVDGAADAGDAGDAGEAAD
ncbi:SAV_2336 N-terminal domain-related protein [Streptomyces sp. NPDC048057]|uniref:SAV_2336 N-terminal domain-related protein n=1 Tax=Streptomyces sp. NPDC048057 TaxID=3155628 RepID=UPI0033F171A6